MGSLGLRWALGAASEGASCEDVSYIFFNARSSRQTVTLESPSVAFLRTLLLGGPWVRAVEKADTGSNLNPWLWGGLERNAEKGPPESGRADWRESLRGAG